MEAIPATDLRVRATIFGVEDFLTISGVVELLEDPGTTVEIYFDGVRQIVTKSVLASSGIAYAFFETTVPAGTTGTIAVEVRTFVVGDLIETDVVAVTFS